MKKLLYNFISSLPTGVNLPDPLCIFIEILSSLQIVQLLLMTMFSNIDQSQFILKSLFKNLSFFTFCFDLNSSKVAIWWICTLYIGVLMLWNSLGIFYMALYDKKLPEKFSKGISLIYLFHSRIIFFPLQFFFYNVLSSSTMSHFFAVTIFLSILNHLFAFPSEFLFCKATNQTNFDAKKNNYYHQIILLYKILVLPLLILSSPQSLLIRKLASILHLSFSITIFLILYKKLPFYKLQMLMLTLSFTSIFTCFSITTIIQACSNSLKLHGSVDIMLLLLPILGIKGTMLIFRGLFYGILSGKVRLSPEYAIHFGLLIEEIMLKDRRNLSILPNEYHVKGVMSGKEGVYECIVERLEGVLNENPQCELLLVYIAEIYLEKLNNVARFLQVLRRIKNNEGVIEGFFKKMEGLYNEEDREYRKGIYRCFEENEILGKIKENILKEVERHVDFWVRIKSRKVDVKGILDQVVVIDKLHEEIKRQFKKTGEIFQRNSIRSLLIEAVYLNNVRYLSHEANQLIKLFELKFLNKLDERDVSLENVNVVISLDKRNPGIVLDVCGPLDSIFSIKKAAILGQNFGCLFPTTIAKIYQANIQEYAKNPSYKMDNKYKTYGKNSQGEMFELEAHFQLYCYGGKEIAVVVMLKKVSEAQMMLIANTEGIIVDCSRRLTEGLYKQKLNIMNQKMIQDIAVELDEVNRLINFMYRNESKGGVQLPGNAIFEEEKEREKSMMIYRSLEEDQEEGREGSTGGDSMLIYPKTTQRDSCRLLRTSFRALSSYITQEKIEGKSELKDIREAKMVCGEFLKGKYVKLDPRNGSPYLKKNKAKVHVKIMPYIFNKEVYKIVLLSDIKGEEDSLDSLDKSLEQLSDQTIADEFPDSAEYTYNHPPKKTVSPNKKLQPPRKSFQQASGTPQVKQEQAKGVIFSEHQASKPSSSRKENEAARTLQELYNSKTPHSALRISIFIVYLTALFILLLSVFNCVLSRSSIKKVETGLDVIHIATDKLISSVNLWQDSLYLYIESFIPGALGNYYVLWFQSDVHNTLKNLDRDNNELAVLLSELGQADLTSQVYEKDIKFYNSADNFDSLNYFLATNRLISQYQLFTGAYDVYDLISRDDVAPLLNNTVNDYMIKCNNIILETEAYLEALTNENITKLKIILTVDLFALLLFCGAVLVVAFVIIVTYKRLFKVILKIKESSIIHQIAQLSSIKEMLKEEDIEANTFISHIMSTFNENSPLQKAKTANLQGQRGNKDLQGPRILTKDFNIYIIRLVFFTIFGVPILAGLFGKSLSSSIDSFKTLDNMKTQIALLSEINYHDYLFINVFNYQALFLAYPGFLILNQPANVLFPKLIAQAYALNSRLSDEFLAYEDQTDDLVRSIIKDNACPLYEDIYATSLCEVDIERFGTRGLFSINFQYIQTTQQYIEKFQAAVATGTFFQVVSDYNIAVTSSLNLLETGFTLLSEYIIAILEAEVKRALKEEYVYLGVIGALVVVYTGFLYWKALRWFVEVDIGRRKVLKVVPWRVVQENKVVSFYLVREFGKECHGIRKMI